MDVAGNVIGLFTAALNAYQKISAAIELGSESLTWDVLMRIERTRFEIWGRTLGFLDEKTGEPKEGGVDAELDDIFQVDAARGLVRDILETITKALEEFEKSANRYRLGGSKESTSYASLDDQRKSRRRDKLWNSTKDFTMHVLMVVKDEDMVRDLLKRLKDLNDGLEKVLSLSQIKQAGRALSSGVLPKYSTSDDLVTILSLADGATVQRPQTPGFNTLTSGLNQHTTLVATAMVKHRCVEIVGGKGPSGQESPSFPIVDIDDFEVSPDRIRIDHIPQRNVQEVQWPNGLGQYSMQGGEEQSRVLIEWRQQATISPGFIIPESELKLRRDLLVRLLHETSNLEAAAEYRILNCLGYFKFTGRVEGAPTPLLGFISRVPSWADGARQPISLQQLLRDAFQCDDANGTPSLRVRFQLAIKITAALYQLQCSGWLHRNLSSDQVIFFYQHSAPADQPRLDAPFLVGLQYSRPDDQSDQNQRSEGFRREDINWGRLGLYLHPDFSSWPRRYKRSDDIYSLGVILFEIAFWEPVEVFRHSSLERVRDVAARILEAARAELAAEAGDLYRDAVLRCLEGLRGPIRKDSPTYSDDQMGDEGQYQGEYAGEDPEWGLEQDLMWKVLREIEKCKV